MKNSLRVLHLLLLFVAAALPLSLAAQPFAANPDFADSAAPAAAAASAPVVAVPASVPASAPSSDGSSPAIEGGLPSAGAQGPTPARSADSASAEPGQSPVTAPRTQPDPSLDSERGDLWQRIRNGFVLPDLQGDRVLSWERYYAGKPDYVQRMTTRGARYLFHIVEEVEKRGMPLELALLPFVESAFNPQAMSSAKASGMWQFMPATGKDFALRQNLFRDDRRDVLASTRAALDYLQRLHKLMGDWHLALAAYNWGQGNVLRAVSVNRNQGKSTSYEHLVMPDETKNYVPKLQAIKNFVMSPGGMGMQLPALENHPYFRSVSIDRDIDVAKAADLAGLTLEDFQALNPQMNKPVILAAGTPQVLLPYDNASRFLQQLQHTRSSLASWTAWVVPRTLKPAEAARHVGMPEDQLREVNRIPARMLVGAGSTLLVPRSSKLLEDVALHVADNATMMLTPEVHPMRRLAFKAGRQGESVASVARRYGLSPAVVANWNKLPVSGHFKSGQAVVVMLPVVPGRGAVGPVAQAVAPAQVSKAPKGHQQQVALHGRPAVKAPVRAAAKSGPVLSAKRTAPAKPKVRTAAKGRPSTGGA